MTLNIASCSPAAFVDELINPGLPTSIGPVALRSYVSTAARSPLAAAVREQLNGLMTQGGEGPRALRALRDRCEDGRGGHWRRLFSGTGHLDRLVELWEWMLAYRDLLATLPPPQGAAGPSWTGWLAQANPLQAMVDAEVFGLDCLGFVSQYIRRSRLMAHAPTWDVEQFGTVASLAPIAAAAGVRPLTLLLFPEAATTAQHIAIVDRVDAVLGDSVRVDLCQSSRGGPQTNRRVVIAPNGATQITLGTLSLRAWTITGGSPPAPVQNPMVPMRRPAWQLGAASG